MADAARRERDGRGGDKPRSHEASSILQDADSDGAGAEGAFAGLKRPRRAWEDSRGLAGHASCGAGPEALAFHLHPAAASYLPPASVAQSEALMRVWEHGFLAGRHWAMAEAEAAAHAHGRCDARGHVFHG